MKPNACRDIIAAHTREIEKRPDPDGANDAHIWRFRHPRHPAERAIVGALRAYAEMADGFTVATEDCDGGIGRDGYFGDHARDYLRAVRALLSFHVGPCQLSNGHIDHLIVKLAEASGVEGL